LLLGNQLTSSQHLIFDYEVNASIVFVPMVLPSRGGKVRIRVREREFNRGRRAKIRRSSGLRTCVDSNMILKEQMAKLDDMELVDKNEDDLGKASDEESDR
jgi:hypothetical protein